MVLLLVPVFEVNGLESDLKLETSASCLVVVIFLPVAEFFEILNAGVGAIFCRICRDRENRGVNLE